MDKYIEAMENAINDGQGSLEFHKIIKLIKEGRSREAESIALELARNLASGEVDRISYRGEDRVERIASRDAQIGLTWAVIYVIRNEMPSAEMALQNALQDLAIIALEKEKITQERIAKIKEVHDRMEFERKNKLELEREERARKEERERLIAEEEKKTKILIIWSIGCSTSLYIVRTTDKELVDNILQAHGKFGGAGGNKKESIWLADYVLELKPITPNELLDPKYFNHIVFSGYEWDGVRRY